MAEAAEETKKFCSRKKYPAPKCPKILENEKKCESNVATQQQISRSSPQLSSFRKLKKCSSKQLSSMFNSKISQIIKGGWIGKPQAKTYFLKAQEIFRNEEKSHQKSVFFITEDNFDILLVREKAQLYTHFINEMSNINPKFNKYAELLKANLKKEAVLDVEVTNEKQESIQHLLEALEARSIFRKKTFLPWAKQKFNSVKHKAKSIEYEDMLTKNSNRNVILQPTSIELRKERKSRSLPREKREVEQVFKELGIIERYQKRCNYRRTCSLPIIFHAPPKKIRRTEAGALAPEIIFQNHQLQNLFFTWLNKRKTETHNSTNTQTGEENFKSKAAIEKLLEETIKSLETFELEQKESCVAEGKEFDIKALRNSKSIKKRSRKKKPAPPIPENINLVNTTISETSVSLYPNLSELQETECGLYTLPKTNSDESGADVYKKESDNVEKDCNTCTEEKMK